jgi:histo-blood group ABO system transferase
MAKIALCVIATNAYIDFTWSLLRSADKYFLQGHDVEYHLFTNKRFIGVTDLRQTYNHLIQHEPWPAMTLKRYHIMSGADLSGYDYVYYIDADMRFVAQVGDEIFGELVGVQHPGFYRGGGSWETNPKSEAYVKPKDRVKYLAGGFQGGSKYVEIGIILAKMIANDSLNSITAVYADESHWNKIYTLNVDKFKLLTPDYCMVEEIEKRKLWGINNFNPRILALAKEHKKYQI